jgi:cytochrome c oxidase subunit 3
MKERVAADLSDLPAHEFGMASPTWWGTAAFMLIEGTGFALAIVVYLYLMSMAPVWPLNAPLPKVLPGTLLTAVLAASIIPNLFVLRWARAKDLRKVRIGLIVMAILGIVPMIIRIFEFPALGVSWDDNAYGSIVWTLLALHTTHILTDIVDTLVLAALMFTRHGDNPRRFGDVQDNVMYWNFVVLAWIPIYLCIYWLPRL